MPEEGVEGYFKHYNEDEYVDCRCSYIINKPFWDKMSGFVWKRPLFVQKVSKD